MKFEFLNILKKSEKYDKKTRANLKPFGEETYQKIDRLHIYDLNLLKFTFSIFI
jgi:hypothetical protein